MLFKVRQILVLVLLQCLSDLGVFDDVQHGLSFLLKALILRSIRSAGDRVSKSSSEGNQSLEGQNASDASDFSSRGFHDAGYNKVEISQEPHRPVQPSWKATPCRAA